MLVENIVLLFNSNELLGNKMLFPLGLDTIDGNSFTN